jgi:hypothetical protein
MTDIAIEQALFHRRDHARPSLQARSPGFQDAWLEEAEGLMAGFGERPAGVRCPQAVFAYPFAVEQVAIVHVADLTEGGGSGFHFFVLPRPAYERFFGDPFVTARLLPPAWQAKGELPTTSLPAVPLPGRTVEEIQRVLQRLKAHALPEDQDPQENPPARTAENSESPALLGGVQVLVDGGRVVFERDQADTGLIPALWTLLPTRSRSGLWPASFAFSNGLGFDALVVPRADGEEYEGYTHEDQAEVYPQGRYELNLQIAVEEGDQRALDSLLNRRTWAESWRLAIILILAFVLVAALPKILDLIEAFFGKQKP